MPNGMPMMPGGAMMPMSPEVQSYGQPGSAGPAGPEQTEQLFKQKFTETAYQVLYSKFTDLASNIITFKILEVDVDEGRGIGVFIVDYNQRILYIPVILTDSKLKPFDIFYCKELNVFLPLTIQWLDEIAKTELDELGEGASIPQVVPQDVNLRNLVIPPVTTTGRVGYASAKNQDLEKNAKYMFKAAEDQTLNIHPQFLNILKTAPKVVLDGVKLAFEKHPGLLQKFASNYGIPALTSAMQLGYQNAKRFEKTASEPDAQTVRVLTKSASHDVIKQVFGPKASTAFQEILKRGFAIRDDRTHFDKIAVKLETPVVLASPGPEAGWYRLFFVDGKPGIYYVIPFPKDSGSCTVHARSSLYGDSPENTHHKPIPYLVISKDGKEVWVSDDVMGEKIFDHKQEGISNSKIEGLLQSRKSAGDVPVSGSYGFFINVTPMSIEATKPERFHTVSTDGDIKKLTTEYGNQTYIIDNDPSRKYLTSAMSGHLWFVPNTAKFVEIMRLTPDSDENYRKIRDYEYRQKNSVIRDPQLLLRWMNRIISNAGATPVNVKSAGIHEWWVGKTDRALSFGPALEKVATMYKISIADASGILESAQAYGIAQAYILDAPSGRKIKGAFEKLAQTPPEQGPMSYEVPQGPMGAMPPQMQQGGMPPEMMQQGGMPPEMMQQGGMPQQPPSMSPTDLAIGEAVQNLQHQTELQSQQSQAQMQQLQQQVAMQQQQSQQLIGVLQGIQQRAAAISSATGGMVPAGAEQSPAIAAQALAPVPPQEEQPPPMPMMDQDTISPEMIAQQINPDMVDQAADFNDQGIFDASAIAMLAAAPILQDIVSTYVPNMEKALDNLGRVLLTIWMKETELKNTVGDEAFLNLENKVSSVFKNLGETILVLTHNATNINPDGNDAQVQKQLRI